MNDKKKRILATSALALVALLGVLAKYWDYVVNPWTRDGHVRATVVEVAPRVSGPIVELPIQDNQFVRAGDLLFQIDPRTYQIAVDQARAQLEETLNTYTASTEQVAAAKAAVASSRHAVSSAKSAIKKAEADLVRSQREFRRQSEMLPRKATSQKAYDQAKSSSEVSEQQRQTAIAELRQAEANLQGALANLAEAQANRGAEGDENPQVRAARATLAQAELNLEFTSVRAPVDGYVSNLLVRLGSQMVANQPQLALIDVNSFWIAGYFRENYIANIRPGDRAVVTLMTYHDKPLEGVVESVGWGIAQSDGSPGFQMLPATQPTFEWIRLAQRIPIRVRIKDLPEGVDLRVGSTASVLVETGTAGDAGEGRATPAPRALQ